MITQERLHELFEYRDGSLIWKMVISMKIKVGDIAGHLNKSRGYFLVGIGRKQYLLHRLIFLYHHGYLTKGLQIDHIDGDRTNNRIENLREVTNQQNAFNAKISSRNKSGVKGVTWDEQSQKWRSVIMLSGKQIHFGFYDTIEEATAVIKKARNEYHGDFARHN